MVLPVNDGLVLSLEADQGVESDATGVTSWADGSGLGNDLTASGDIQFSTVATPSGLFALELDGEGDKLERIGSLAGLPAGNGDRTIFFVVDYQDPQGVTAGVVYGDARRNETFGLAADVDNDLMVQGYGQTADADAPVDGVTSGWIVQSAVLSNGVVNHYQNGTLIDSFTRSYQTDPQKLVIGEEIGGLGFADMNVAAVIIYDRALTEQERADVESFLQSKYLTTGENPLALDDSVGVSIGASASFDILSNDIDNAPLDGSAVTIVNGPANGTIDAIDPVTGVVTYTHDGGASTSDSFTYQLTDVDGNVSNTATVSIEVGIQPLSLEGFSDELVVARGSFQGGSPFFLPISMAFLPDNRMLALSKDGEIRIIDPETGANSIYLTLNNIDAGQERGLLDITLDPDFATNGYFYLYYTPDNPENARIARFTHNENSGGLTARGDLASEFVVWEDTDGYLSCCHYGGGLDFGPDGKIWLTTSDKFQATTPGEGASGGIDLPLLLESSSGKVIRINSDGTIPDGSDGWPANPFIDGPGGNDDSVWAYGLRNPFRARWDAEYEQMFIGEVGGNQQNIAHDDLHLASLDQAGAFYGWPFYEGVPNTYVNNFQSALDPIDFPDADNDLADPANGDFYSAPIWSLDHQGVSASLTGGEVYRGNLFPGEWDGVYFYGDYTRDYIRYLVLDETGTEVLGDFAFKPTAELPGSVNEVVSIAVGNDGALYYATISNGEIRRVTFDGNSAPDIISASISDVAGPLPLSIVFNAEVTDAEGDVLTYTLNFGDGTIVGGVVGTDGLISQSHIYSENGRFSVSLSVSDGVRTSFSQGFEVEAGDVNFAPEIVNEGSDISIAAAGDTEVVFTANVSDLDGDALTYVWNFGDGSTAAGVVDPSGIVTASYVYPVEGSFSAFLEVSDGTATVFSGNIPVQVGTATQVPVTTGLVLLLQSDIKIGLGEGNTVSAWLDGSGNGNNLFAEGDPQLLENRTPTGQSAIVFDGVGDLIQRVDATDQIFNLPTGAADRTIFFVVNYLDHEGISAGVAYGDGAKNETFGLVSDWNGGDLAIQGWGGANDFDSGIDAASQGWIVQSVTLNQDQYTHYLNGLAIAGGQHRFNTDLRSLILGGEIAGLGEAALEIGAVLIYNRALNESERQQVEAFLQAKYITGDADNEAPLAANDALTFTEDTAVSGDVLADNGAGADTDADGDTLTVSLVADAANGLLTLNPDGTFTYDPNTDFNGVDSFIYRVSDGKGGVDEATVTLTGAPVDDPAVANNDAYSTDVDTALNVVPAAGVLANDTDAEGDPITATLVTGVSHGTLTLNGDGGFTYLPNAGFEGADSFVYSVEGGDTATVSIGVGGTTNIQVLSGLVGLYQAEQNVSVGTGALVTGWLDGSGLGNDLLSEGDPTLIANATPTGLSAISFDGDGDVLHRINATDTLTGFASGSADRSIFFVVDYKNHNSVSAGVAYGDGAKNQTFGLVSDWNGGDLAVQGWGRANDFDSGVDAASQGWMVQSVVLNDNNFTHYLNGVAISSGNHVFNTDLQLFEIAGEIAGLGEGTLDVAAVAIYNRALDESERESVESFLQNKYIDDGFIFV